jgi:ABC-2 type transport system permease protein
MRAALIIAWKDLKQRLRDRSAIVAAFGAPLLLAFIISFAFGSGFTGNFSAFYLVVDADKSPLSKAFADQVLRAPQLRDQISSGAAKSQAAAKEIIARDGASAAFVFPKGFQSSVFGNRKAKITVLRNAENLIGSDVAEAIAKAYTAQINAARLSVFSAVRSTQQKTGNIVLPAEIARFARAAGAERIPVQLVDGRIGVRDLSGANYFGPAMAVFSLFFTTAFVARSVIAERQGGTLPRILASPIPRQAIVLGKSLTAFVIGISSFAVMFVMFGLLLDVEWGDPLAIVVLTTTTVLAVMGLMTVMQTFSKTQEGADAVSQVLTMSLALLGGNFFPIFQMPEMMQRLSLITPNGWALRGFTDIAYDGATLTDLGPHLLAIGAFAVVTGSVGLWRAQRLT